MTDYTNLIARLRGLSSAARNPLIVADPLEHAADEALAAIAALQAQVREMALDVLAASGQAQEAYQAQLAAEAQIAALTARVEGLTGALDKARTQDRDPDYVYDEEWEYTMRWDEWPDLVDGHDLTEPMPIYTLYKGPTKWVVQIPIDTDGDGETDDFETKLFDSEETARAALSAATEQGHE